MRPDHRFASFPKGLDLRYFSRPDSTRHPAQDSLAPGAFHLERGDSAPSAAGVVASTGTVAEFKSPGILRADRLSLPNAVSSLLIVAPVAVRPFNACMRNARVRAIGPLLVGGLLL